MYCGNDGDLDGLPDALEAMMCTLDDDLDEGTREERTDPGGD
jgi:hypothetical protein